MNRNISGADALGQAYLEAMAECGERLLPEVEKLETASLTDPLTGLGNRRGYELYVNEVLSLLSRGSTEKRRSTLSDMAVLSIDVNGLKETNDTLGHASGDQVLVYAAEAIRKSLYRDADEGFRVGGDEFFVVLPTADGVIEKIAKRIYDRFGELVGNERTKVPDLDIAIGYSSTNVLCSPKDLEFEADRMMYVDKQTMTERSYPAADL